MPVSYTVGGRVPDILLPRAQDGVPSPVRGMPRDAVVLVFPEPGDAERWTAYLQDLVDAADAFGDWDGRVILRVPHPHAGWDRLDGAGRDRIRVLRDPEGRLEPRGGAGDDGGLPAVALADRYGEIYRVWPTREPGRAPGPAPRALEEWLQFLALQCPE